MNNQPASKEPDDLPPATNELSEIENTQMLAEYQALRDDILMRIQFRYQLINLLLLVAGALLSVGLGLKPGIAAPVLLIYPILAFFLSASWAHNGVVIVRIGQYIKEEIESKIAGLNWQTNIRKSSPQFSGFSILGLISTSGLILTTQILALLLALLRFSRTPVEIVMLIFSSAAIIATAFLLWYVKGISR